MINVIAKITGIPKPIDIPRIIGIIDFVSFEVTFRVISLDSDEMFNVVSVVLILNL